MTSNPERDLHTYLAADVAPTGIRTDEFGRLHNQRVSAPAGLPLHEPTDRDASDVPSDRVRAYAEAFRARKGPRCAECVELDDWSDCAECDAVVAVEVADRGQAALRAEIERLRNGWGSVTSALGYGDGITEPQISFAEFIRECEQRFSEADEWRESQRWRDECAMAGHADTEDCFEHDPTLRIERLAEDWANTADYNEDTHPREAKAFRKAAQELRAVLRGPESTDAP